MFPPLKNSDHFAPLAERMRPSSVNEIYGQEHILGEGKLLRRMIERDAVTSMVFFGAPGTGKSSLANIIIKETKSESIRLNAVLSNVSEIRTCIKKGESNLLLGRKTILFIDEIHRFNKSQQDALLPAIENGTVTLIGSTTQNPYFYLTNALLSRITLFEFKSLSKEDIKKALRASLGDERGLGKESVEIGEDGLDLIVGSSLGDLRKAFNYLEAAFLASKSDQMTEKLLITLERVKEATSKQGIKFDEDEHYNIISAFIKSVRGSDANAAVYYLARMLESGEDPRFIARRLCILAAEDIGLADTNALSMVSSLVHIVDFIGMPEARIPLSEVTLYLSLCPKSNSAYLAISKALKDVKNGGLLEIPNYLKDPHSSSYDRQSHEGYQYPHDYPYHIVKQDYLERGIKKHYYDPIDIGEERELKKRYEWILKRLRDDE